VVWATDADGGYRILGHVDPTKIKIEPACAI
jgi:hypothetical protein